MIRSVLRYPGGKSKVAQKIVSLIPPNIKEFREPMVGGGSVSLVFKQTLPHVKVWINDIDYDRNLHTSFDHQRFAENMKKCKHLWLITYDDCEEIRKLFSFAYIYPWEIQYGMTAKKGKELFITNYKTG